MNEQPSLWDIRAAFKLDWGSKLRFAEKLGISPSRVTRYLQKKQIGDDVIWKALIAETRQLNRKRNGKRARG